MRVVLQRALEASVKIDGEIHGKIGIGLVILVGIAEDDELTDLEWMVKKIVQMRIFSDADGLMNLSVKDVNGELLVISQFTLHAKTKKGNRPSFILAARPEKAIPLYEKFKALLSAAIQKPVACGVFGADMQVSLINYGPVTITLDSKLKE